MWSVYHARLWAAWVDNKACVIHLAILPAWHDNHRVLSAFIDHLAATSHVTRWIVLGVTVWRINTRCASRSSTWNAWLLDLAWMDRCCGRNSTASALYNSRRRRSCLLICRRCSATHCSLCQVLKGCWVASVCCDVRVIYYEGIYVVVGDYIRHDFLVLFLASGYSPTTLMLLSGRLLTWILADAGSCKGHVGGFFLAIGLFLEYYFGTFAKLLLKRLA